MDFIFVVMNGPVKMLFLGSQVHAHASTAWLHKQVPFLSDAFRSTIPPFACRGPLLESCVDLEQRLWHTLTRTGEWTPGADSLCFEEISYTMFTLSQVMGHECMVAGMAWGQG